MSKKKTKPDTVPVESEKELSYFESRMKELGITEDHNKIKLKFHCDESNTTRQVEYKIFSEDDEGNIRITPFTLNRELIQYDSVKATPTIRNIENSRNKIFYVTRLRDPQPYIDKKGELQDGKYRFPKGAETQPFVTPGLCDKWEKGIMIETLVLTEGYFKAFKGYLSGLDIVGLSSITHVKQKETHTMYKDVLTIIKDCHVKNVIILYDGDARNISSKDLEKKRDLRRRPDGFIRSAREVRELLKDCKVDIYFSSIKSEDITGNPKGLDDLYCSLPDETDIISKDLLSFSRPGTYFSRHNITLDFGKLYKWFMLDSVENFYGYHQKYIGGREFIFNGTTYLYDPDKGKCNVVIPGDAANYFRVGDDYYKFVHIPNKYKQLEKKFVPRKKGTITEDHDKKFTKFIPKYEAFCNIPDHTNYQQVAHNCFNVYSRFEHEPEEGDCSTTLDFIRHIFGEQYELGLDYIQLLYQQPTQILPILCLVSKQNKTGKSTFIKLLKAIFTQNCTIIGNDDLGNQFNGFWSTKLIVACEESFIDKKVVIEKIKALSTADTINMNKKGKDQNEIDFFAKFILASNNEDTFIYASRDDVRYWVRQIPVFEGKEKVNLLQEMIDEIPAFLDSLNKRKMSTQNETRMWFNENILRTEALDKLIHNSRPGIEKELYEHLKTIFFEFGESEVLMTPTDANTYFLKKHQDINYLSKIFRENLYAKPFVNDEGKEVVKAYSIPYWHSEIEGISRQDRKLKGRPFVFKAESILTKSDLLKWKEITIVHEPEKKEELIITEAIEQDLPF